MCFSCDQYAYAYTILCIYYKPIPRGAHARIYIARFCVKQHSQISNDFPSGYDRLLAHLKLSTVCVCAVVSQCSSNERARTRLSGEPKNCASFMISCQKWIGVSYMVRYKVHWWLPCTLSLFVSQIEPIAVIYLVYNGR